MRFSEFFALHGTQSNFDFVDVPLETDIELFIDPLAIAKSDSPWSRQAHAQVCNFFQAVLDRLRAGDRMGAELLVDVLGEDNRTRLGYSRAKPQGSGLGSEKAGPFLDLLGESDAFKTGRIQDVEELSLLVPGVDCDIVSDMITNVIRNLLVEYTMQQCELYGIQMTQKESVNAWKPGQGWVKQEASLPTDGDRAIILVPRAVVCRRFSLAPDQYMTEILDQYDRGSPSAMQALEELLQTVPKKGEGKVSRNEAREALRRRGNIKDVLARLTSSNPSALESYKKRARRRHRTPSVASIEALHVKPILGDRAGQIKEMHLAAKNADQAAVAMPVLSLWLSCFHPSFQRPRYVRLDERHHGVLLDNVCSGGQAWQHKRNGSHLLIYTVSKPIDQSVLRDLDADAWKTANSAGVVAVVGHSFDKEILAARASLEEKGLWLLSIDELGKIASESSDAESAMVSLETILT